MDIPEIDIENDSAEHEPEGLDEFADLLMQMEGAAEEGRDEDTLALIGSLMAIASERAETEVPSPHLACRLEASDREAEADWMGAEAAYRRALQIAGDDVHERWIDHGSLRDLYRLMGRLDEALEEARAAVVAGQEALELLHAQALICQASIQLEMGQVSDAIDSVTQAIPLYPNGAFTGAWHARGLALRARCHIELDDEMAARRDLDESWRLLEPESAMASLPGVQGAFGAWWRADAALRKRKGDTDGCVKAWREVVLSRRWNAAQPQIAGPYTQEALAGALESLASAQDEAGDPVSAVENRAESRAIRQEIMQPGSRQDPAETTLDGNHSTDILSG